MGKIVSENIGWDVVTLRVDYWPTEDGPIQSRSTTIHRDTTDSLDIGDPVKIAWAWKPIAEAISTAELNKYGYDRAIFVPGHPGGEEIILKFGYPAGSVPVGPQQAQMRFGA